MKFLTAFLTMFILFAEAGAASKPYIRNGSADASIDAEGVKFNTMKGSTATPMAFPDAISFYNRKDPTIKIELINKNELWKYEQILGRWFGSGGSMIFAKIKFPLPEGIKVIADNQPDFIKKEDFQNWKKSVELKLSGESDIQNWIESFAGCKIKKDEAFKNKKPKIEIAHYICDDPYKDLYYVADPENSERKYVMLFEIENNADIKKSMKNIPAIAGTFSFFVPKKTSRDDKKLVTKKSAGITDRSPEYIESRDKVIANIKNLSGWWYIETENYIFTADLEDKKLIDEMQLQIEKCRSIYEKYFELKGSLRKISVVKSFSSRDKYLKYLDDKDSFSIGMWSSAKEELIISPVSGNKRENREEMVKILYHEGFHQYIFYASNMIQSSPWFNEGHATFFEGLEFKSRNIEIDTTRRLDDFQSSTGGSLSKGMINNLIHLDYTQFYERDSFQKNYSSVWGLVYFLNKGAPAMGKFEYAVIPLKYYQALHDLKDPEKATEEAWKDIDLDAFSKDMLKFYNTKKYTRKAEKYDFMKNKDLLKKTSGTEKSP